MNKFIISFMLCLLPCFLMASTFHALLIGDSETRSHKPILKQDFSFVRRNLYLIGNSCSVHVNLKTFSLKKASMKSLSKWLGKCNITNDDCLFIYFSGAGYCADKNQSPWPTMLLGAKRERLSLENIDNVLAKLNPRLSIVLYDTANLDMTSSDPFKNTLPLTGKVHFKKLAHPKFPEYKPLFLKSKGSIVLAAAQPGSDKLADSQGSYLTRIFFMTLMRKAQHSNASWDSVLKKVTKRCLKLPQKPLVDVMLN